jgi:hypothetical protein
MDFYVDMGIAVLLRLLKDKKQRVAYKSAFAKLYNSIGLAFNVHHVYWNSEEVVQKGL